MSESTPVLERAVKVVGEACVPGASLLLDGRIKEGAIHTAAGLGGRLLLGPIGFVLAAANSFSNSVAGKHLHEHFKKS